MAIRSKDKHINVDNNPWAGLASYEDPETAERKLKFCGRDDDSYDLARLIMGNVFVTLYGKSGIGKTSLLNAGVFPELREEQFTPVSIRLGMRDDEHPQSYQTMIVEAVERVVKRTETINVIDEQQDQQSIDYLWNYFARHRFYDKYDEPTTPVIVFDQFEEVFRGHRDEAEILLRQQDYLNDKDHTLDSCQVDGRPYRYEQNFRFVVSIREDDLYRLEDSIDNCYLPALKRCRYRLRSLSEQSAEAIILVPGEGLFKEEEQEGIVDTIIEIARNKEDKSISTNVLSLICNRIFVDFQKSRVDHITPSLVDTFIKGNPFERFYNEATRGFSNKEKSYIEDNLVDSTGRRNSIPESNFLKHISKGQQLLEGNTRILQRTSTSSDGGNYRIELIHDSFCEPLAKQKEVREKRKRMQWLASVAGVALLCLGITGYILYQMNKISRQEGTIAQQDADLFATNQRLLKEQDSLWLTNEKLIQIFKDLQLQKGITDSTNQQLELSFLQLMEKEQQLSQTNYGMLVNQSKVLAEKASTLADEGDSYLARLLALQALPPNRPYTPEAESALRKAVKQDNVILRGHTSQVNSASFSPDGKYIVSASMDKTVRIWDAATGRQVGSPLKGHTSDVFSVSFSPNGKYIVSVSYDETVRIWDPATGMQVSGYKGQVYSASFSPDDKRIVSASRDNTVRIWDAQTGRQIGSPLKGHTNWVCSAAFSPDGKRIVSASADSTIRIWDAQTGEQIGSPLKGHVERVKSASFSPDGKYIVSASDDNTIRIWDVATGSQVGSPLEGHTAVVKSASFSPDGKYIVSASNDKIVRIWDAVTHRQVGSLIEGHTGVVNSASFSPDGKYIVFALNDNTIHIWDAFTQRQVRSPLEGHTGGVGCSASFSPDGKYIVSASNDETVRIWDTSTGRQVGSPLKGHTSSVNSSSFSPDGKYIVSASNDNTIRIWDAQTGEQIGNPLRGHTSIVTSASFSPDGKYIVSASDDNTIRIWDVATGSQVGSPLEGHTAVVWSAFFSPDGKYIVSASNDKTVRIWDAITHRQVGSPLKGHVERVKSASFSPDGKYIVSASDDNTIRIWDVATGSQVGSPLEGHTAVVESASFSPDGKYIVSASNDETVRIWDASTGRQVDTLPVTSNLNSAFFSPDGKYIVSASWDDIRIWDFPSLEDLIDQTRERFKDRQLTPEERRKYYLE